MQVTSIGEHAGNQHFLLCQQSYLQFQRQISEKSQTVEQVWESENTQVVCKDDVLFVFLLYDRSWLLSHLFILSWKSLNIFVPPRKIIIWFMKSTEFSTKMKSNQTLMFSPGFSCITI